MTELTTYIQGQFKVFIDASNVHISVRDNLYVTENDIPKEFNQYDAKNLCWSVDYRKLNTYFQNIQGYSGINFYTPYFTGTPAVHFRNLLTQTLAFNVVEKPVKVYKDGARKANFDVEMAVDAVSGLDGYNTLVIFSGDSDFEYLVKYLKQQGKVVICISCRGSIAKELIQVVSKYYDIFAFKNELLQVRTLKRPTQ